MSWKALVEAVARRERTAEEEVARTFQPRVLAFVAERTQDRTLAHDLSQEILLAVICALREEKLREPESLPAFIYGIARNRLNDYLRRRAQEKLTPLPEHFDVASAPEDSAHAAMVETALAAIDSLETQDQRILLMTLVEGLKPAEISRATGLSSMVVRQRKSRALKRVVEIVQSMSQKRVKAPLTFGDRQ